MVAEETVSRAASQLSFALHREENSSGTEERREEKSEEKSNSEIRVASALDAEVLRLGVMSPAAPQVDPPSPIKNVQHLSKRVQKTGFVVIGNFPQSLTHGGYFELAQPG